MKIIVQPIISKSPGAAQLAELLTAEVNSMKDGLRRFQTIQTLKRAGYAVTYSRRQG